MANPHARLRPILRLATHPRLNRPHAPDAFQLISRQLLIVEARRLARPTINNNEVTRVDVTLELLKPRRTQAGASRHESALAFSFRHLAA